jgi:hypothetical protein
LGNELFPNIQLEKLSSLTRRKKVEVWDDWGNMMMMFLLLVRRVLAGWTPATRLQAFEKFYNQWHEPEIFTKTGDSRIVFVHISPIY